MSRATTEAQEIDVEVAKQFVNPFCRSYAGPQTPMLEEKCLELSGRQDSFCMICLKHKPESQLFPQVDDQEIHLCPRKFCESCYWIEPHWRAKSKRFDSILYKEYSGWVVQCCALCWKRYWDEVNPVIGPRNPHWRDHAEAKHKLQSYRRKLWKRCLDGQDKRHVWRTKLLDFHDDMTLESDRELLKAVDKALPKNRIKNPVFSPIPSEGIQSGTSGNMKPLNTVEPFNVMCKWLVDNVRALSLDEDVPRKRSSDSASPMVKKQKRLANTTSGRSNPSNIQSADDSSKNQSTKTKTNSFAHREEHCPDARTDLTFDNASAGTTKGSKPLIECNTETQRVTIRFSAPRVTELSKVQFAQRSNRRSSSSMSDRSENAVVLNTLESSEVEKHRGQEMKAEVANIAPESLTQVEAIEDSLACGHLQELSVQGQLGRRSSEADDVAGSSSTHYTTKSFNEAAASDTTKRTVFEHDQHTEAIAKHLKGLTDHTSMFLDQFKAQHKDISTIRQNCQDLEKDNQVLQEQKQKLSRNKRKLKQAIHLLEQELEQVSIKQKDRDKEHFSRINDLEVDNALFIEQCNTKSEEIKELKRDNEVTRLSNNILEADLECLQHKLLRIEEKNQSQSEELIRAQKRLHEVTAERDKLVLSGVEIEALYEADITRFEQQNDINARIEDTLRAKYAEQKKTLEKDVDSTLRVLNSMSSELRRKLELIEERPAQLSTSAKYNRLDVEFASFRRDSANMLAQLLWTQSELMNFSAEQGQVYVHGTYLSDETIARLRCPEFEAKIAVFGLDWSDVVATGHNRDAPERESRAITPM